MSILKNEIYDWVDSWERYESEMLIQKPIQWPVFWANSILNSEEYKNSEYFNRFL